MRPGCWPGSFTWSVTSVALAPLSRVQASQRTPVSEWKSNAVIDIDRFTRLDCIQGLIEMGQASRATACVLGMDHSGSCSKRPLFHRRNCFQGSSVAIWCFDQLYSLVPGSRWWFSWASAAAHISRRLFRVLFCIGFGTTRGGTVSTSSPHPWRSSAL